MTAVGHVEGGRAGQLRAQQRGERARLLALRHRLTTIDPATTPHAHAAIVSMIAATQARLREIEGELTGELVSAPIPVPDDSDGEVDAGHQLRARLHHLAVVLSNVPPSCAGPASRLKAAINRELRTLEAEQRGTP